MSEALPQPPPAHTPLPLPASGSGNVLGPGSTTRPHLYYGARDARCTPTWATYDGSTWPTVMHAMLNSRSAIELPVPPARSVIGPQSVPMAGDLVRVFRMTATRPGRPAPSQAHVEEQNYVKHDGEPL